jgi:hypothetical protein
MNLESRHPVEAKRIGTSLVAAFHRANPPLVWRFDLERNHSFSLALQGDEGEWELGLTSPKGDFQPVARFAVREDAEVAFIKVERILSKRDIAWFKLALKIVAVIVLLIAIAIPLSFFKIQWGSSQKSDTITSMTPSAAAPYAGMPEGAMPPQQPAPPPKPGVPVSADDFLKSGQ